MFMVHSATGIGGGKRKATPKKSTASGIGGGKRKPQAARVETRGTASK